jgi:hypothetical protein
MGYPGSGSFAKSGYRLPDVGDPSRGLLAGLGPGKGPILVRALGGDPSGRVTAWVIPGGRHGETESWSTVGRPTVVGLESGSMFELWPGSACQAVVPGGVVGGW